MTGEIKRAITYFLILTQLGCATNFLNKIKKTDNQKTDIQYSFNISNPKNYATEIRKTYQNQLIGLDAQPVPLFSPEITPDQGKEIFELEKIIKEISRQDSSINIEYLKTGNVLLLSQNLQDTLANLEPEENAIRKKIINNAASNYLFDEITDVAGKTKDVNVIKEKINIYNDLVTAGIVSEFHDENLNRYVINTTAGENSNISQKTRLSFYRSALKNCTNAINHLEKNNKNNISQDIDISGIEISDQLDVKVWHYYAGKTFYEMGRLSKGKQRKQYYANARQEFELAIKTHPTIELPKDIVDEIKTMHYYK